MASKKKLVAPPPLTIRPTPEDRKLLECISRKLGVSFSQVIRIGLRLLAEKEGLIGLSPYTIEDLVAHVPERMKKSWQRSVEKNRV